MQLDGFEFTKRNVLKKTATVYDPLGFLSPYIVRLKLLMQKAWLEAGTWDDLFPEHHQQEWIKRFQQLNDLELVKIPRCLKDPVAKVVELSIHTFTDASESAYAAVVYARHVYESGEVTVRLIASKSRLAPLKAVSIPRLELLGTLIGTRLTKQVCTALKVSSHEVTYWVDSVNVGYWIRGQSREYKPFIAHRVGEIHECSGPSQWCYVPTNVNPADHGTRGLTVEELTNTSQWWNGPEFLTRSENEWPECKFDVPASDESLELKRRKEVSGKTTCSYEITKGGEENADGNNAREEGVWRLNPLRYSKWYWVKPKGQPELGLSLVRVKAWVHRFTANCRRPANQRLQGELMPKELEDAEEAIIREVQTEKYAAEMDDDINVSVNGSQLENVQCAKLLGLEIDKELAFHSHVDKLCKKLSQRIGILKKIKHCLQIKHRVLFYNAIIRPVMDYVSVIWSNCDKHCLDRVLKLQKRAARIVIGADSYAPSVQLFNILKWIPFFKNAKLAKCCIIYKRLQGCACLVILLTY